MTDRGIRYHLPWQQYVWYLLPLSPPVVLLASGRGAPAAIVLPTFAFGAAGLAVMWRRFGAEVRPDALVLHGIRRRVLQCARIERIEHRKKWWGTSVKVYADGRGWTLRAPVHDRLSSPDPEFDAKLETIQRAWAAHRLDRWTLADA
jgi:hypothetical protein